MAVPFRMRIRDAFSFQDGRTVLVGPVEGAEGYIPATMCEIWVNGQKLATVRIEGEMIPCGSDNGQRAVSTHDATGLSRELICRQECTLRSVESPTSQGPVLQAEHGRV
jgi:hypothetical protein